MYMYLHYGNIFVAMIMLTTITTTTTILKVYDE